MSTRIEVTLPDAVYRAAERLAQLTHRRVADVLADTLALSLPSLDTPVTNMRSMSELSDKAILELTELQLMPEQDRRLSTLLEKQQANELSEVERTELQALMQLYQEGLLRKSQALHEAVRRGLQEPLTA